MKRLWVAAALAPLSFAATAHAQTTTNPVVTIGSSTTTPVFTATAQASGPADITIGSGGTIDPKTAGTATAQVSAVTINSNNNVINNGTINTQNLSFTTGILAQGGFTGSITNNTAIQLGEDSNGKTNGTNGIVDTPFAVGTNRFGIEVTGTSPFASPSGVVTITNGGSITIVGNNSAGILIGTSTTAPAGLDAGSATATALGQTGTISVTGDNSFGIHSFGPINGGLAIGGSVSATGHNAVGVALDQGATGIVDIAGTINVTGFHSLIPPVAANQVKSLEPSQLLPGGPAVSIGGSVGGGVVIEAATTGSAATATAPAVGGTAAGEITANGSTALVIGSPLAGAGPITIGPGPSGASLLVGGVINSSGLYNNFNATGAQIGSTGGAAVNLPGGILISGSLTAATVATNLGATDGAGNPISGQSIALHLGAGANVGGAITITGGLAASSTSTVANTVTALQIDPGVVGGVTLTNSGAITAAIAGIPAVVGGSQAAAGGVLGNVTAISDQAGALSTINNTGFISASITPIIPGQLPTGSTIAFDLRANTTGVTVNQTQAPTIPAVAATSTTAAVAAIVPAAPTLAGDVLFGSGAANLNVLAGTLTGTVAFGANAGNTLDVEGGAVMTGPLTQAAGGSLAINVGTGGPQANSGLTGGTLNMTGAPTHLAITSLNVGAAGVVDFTLDPHAGIGDQFVVSGAANLAAGSKIGLNLVSTTAGPQTFTLITASSLAGGAVLGPSPFLFNATLSQTNGANGTVDVTVSPRTAAQLGLNTAETAAYNAIFTQFGVDPGVAADVLSKQNRADFIHIYDQFLPDFEGGPFDSLVVGQGQIAQAQADQPIKLQGDGPRGWVQEIGFLDNRQDTTNANGYRAGGFGIIGGLEQDHGDTAVGLSAAFVTDGIKDDRQGPGGLVSTAGVEVGAYWRDGTGGDGLNMHASVNGGYLFLSSHRLLFDQDAAGNVGLFREAKSQWNGATVSAEFGASYQVPIGKFYIRPEVIADYVYLYESAFSEHGGGASEDLAVASRSSGEGSVQGDLVFGADLGGVNHWRPELTVGWREVVSGGPGDTTARFVSGGPSFTLSPQFQDKGSLIARIGVHAGGNFADFSADAGGQLNETYQVYNARAVARFLF